MNISRILLLLLIPLTIQAQYGPEEVKVKQAIDQLFDAMRQGDSASLRDLMHPDLRMLTFDVDENGNDRQRSGSLDAWLNGVAGAEPGALDEKVWSYAIHVDKNLATVWTPYTFFLNDNPHHCGVNAFQLFRDRGEWKIIQVTDTRSTSSCPTSPEDIEGRLNALIDNWHRAAARADADTFFGAMAEDGVYIGTDANERWLRDEFRAWAKDAFERDSAWAFEPKERHLEIAPDGSIAWWDEILETWMGPCRATGILKLSSQGWKIQHYQLSVTLPNEKMPQFLELIGN